MILLFQHPPPQRIVNDVAKMAVTCCDMLFAALSASSAPGTYLHSPTYLYGTCSCSFLGPVSAPVLRNGSHGKVDRAPTSIGVEALLNTQNQALLCVWSQILAPHLSTCICLRPENRPSVFAFFFCVVICWGAGGGVAGCNNVLCLRYHRFFGEHTSCDVAHWRGVGRGEVRNNVSCYVARVCCASMHTSPFTLQASVVLRWTRFMLRCMCGCAFNSVNALHAALRACALIRWTHFILRCALLLYFGEHMLRCTRMLYFGDQTPRYVARFCCSSVNTLHATLRTSVVRLWTHFMLRCACVLYFGEHTSCYVVRVCFNSVNAFHVMLIPFFKKSVNTLHVTLLNFGKHTSFFVARVLCTSVNTLHVTLRAYVLTWWTHFMLRCTLLLYFGDHTLCYAARARFMLRCVRVCFNSVNDGERTSR